MSKIYKNGVVYFYGNYSQTILTSNYNGNQRFDNYATVKPSSGVGVYIDSFAILKNENGGSIYGSNNSAGVFSNRFADVYNYGRIQGGAGWIGVDLQGGAYFRNSGEIYGGSGSYGGAGVRIHGYGRSYFDNFNNITGGTGTGFGSGGGSGVILNGNVRGYNFGTIKGGAGNYFGGDGVDTRGYLYNRGTITGASGFRSGGDGVYQYGNLLNNWGQITGGGSNTDFRSGAGVWLGNNANLINHDVIVGGSGFGGGFGVVNDSSGYIHNYGTISGGATAYTGNYGGGGGVSLRGGALKNVGSIYGGAGKSSSYGANAGGTAVQVDTNSTVNNKGRIIGGAGGTNSYSNGTGGAGGAGITDGYNAPINNYGNYSGYLAGIQGGAGGGGGKYGGSGGDGVDLFAGQLTNQASDGIRGGRGGTDNYNTYSRNHHGGAGGAGVSTLDPNAVITNYGIIRGGQGGNSLHGVSGSGGAGVYSLGTVNNSGFIDGAFGGYSLFVGGAGGVGVNLNTGSNSGTIYGGVGGGYFAGTYAQFGGQGGAGVNVTANGAFTNSGKIFGGGGRAGRILHGAGLGGVGLNLASNAMATNTNTGTIQGGNGGYAGHARNQSYAGAGGVGVYLGSGATFTNAGSVIGGMSGYNSAPVQSDAVLFGGAGTLSVQYGASFFGDIGGFNSGDVVDITNLTPAQVQSDFNSATDTITTPHDGTLVFSGPFTGEQFTFTSDGGSGTDVTLVPCFRRGTRIRTERGETAVESLRIGDYVTTLSGTKRPIRWIGRRSYTRAVASGNRKVLPVLIRAGALSDAVPHRDLWVSPEHAMFIDGMLIPAQALVNGMSISQPDAAVAVEYFHLEFDAHEVIYAEGAPSESYVDEANRNRFDNAAEYAALYPDAVPAPARFCAPRTEEGEALEAVRQRLAVRAAMLAPQDRRAA